MSNILLFQFGLVYWHEAHTFVEPMLRAVRISIPTLSDQSV